MESKKLLGQFYTTNSDYILQGLTIPDGIEIVEPFVGNGDLVGWIERNIKDYSIQTFDIDPKTECSEVRDTLLTPPSYEGKYVITNPPFLAKNKNENKTLYNKYNVDDLYKSFLITIIDGNCQGGIVIIPLNFFSSENSETRIKFLSNYKIGLVNVFEEQVFDDTSYTICSFNFSKKQDISYQNVKFLIYPQKKIVEFSLSYDYGFKIGGNILDCKNNLRLGRLLIGQTESTNMTLYSVDSGGLDGRIRLVIHDRPYFGKDTDRVFCTITSPEQLFNQNEICDEFNNRLKCMREDYNSLFLTNYRESTKHYSRKRISFKQAFCLISQIISENESRFKRG